MVSVNGCFTVKNVHVNCREGSVAGWCPSMDVSMTTSLKYINYITYLTSYCKNQCFKKNDSLNRNAKRMLHVNRAVLFFQ